MKNVLDTNPIIRACILQDYKERVIDYIQDSDSLTVLTIYNEVKDKLLLLHTALLGLEKISLRGDKKLILNLPLYQDIKKISEEIYRFIEEANEKEIPNLTRKVQVIVGILLSKIRKLQVYPSDDRKKQEIISNLKKTFSEKLPKLKENDLNHLYLMYDYTQNFASIINFYTEDKIDYLNNKEKIEEVLKDIKIIDFSNFKSKEKI